MSEVTLNEKLRTLYPDGESLKSAFPELHECFCGHRRIDPIEPWEAFRLEGEILSLLWDYGLPGEEWIDFTESAETRRKEYVLKCAYEVVDLLSRRGVTVEQATEIFDIAKDIIWDSRFRA